MVDKTAEDSNALGHVIDDDKLRRKYQQALNSGCTPEFAKTYVMEIAQTMAMNEAGQFAVTPGVMEATLTNAGVFRENP